MAKRDRAEGDGADDVKKAREGPAEEQVHRGVVVPMATPLTATGDLDEDGVRRVVNFLCEGGVGLMVAGTTGEGPSLSLIQRRRLVALSLEEARGRVLVYAGIGGTCVSDSVSFGRECLEMGVAAVVAHLPPYFALQPREMVSFYLALADQLGGPLMLYNIPITTHMSIPLDALSTLSQHPNIVGIKDSEKNPTRFNQLIDLFRGRNDFVVFAGSASTSAEGILYGACGVVPSGGNLVPAKWHSLYLAARAGEAEKAFELQVEVNRITSVYMPPGRTLGRALAAMKGAMAVMGLCGPAMLPPLLPVSEEEQATMRDELTALGVLGVMS